MDPSFVPNRHWHVPGGKLQCFSGGLHGKCKKKVDLRHGFVVFFGWVMMFFDGDLDHRVESPSYSPAWGCVFDIFRTHFFLGSLLSLSFFFHGFYRGFTTIWGPLNMFGSSCCFLSASVQESQIQAWQTDIISRPMKKIRQFFWVVFIYQSWLVVSNIFFIHPYLGKIPMLTNMFQIGLKPPTSYHQNDGFCPFYVSLRERKSRNQRNF